MMTDKTHIMDILDTSALRSLSKTDIVALNKKRPISVSFISVYELLCHLDEVPPGMNPQQGFDYRKVSILKARDLNIKYSPFAYYTERLGAVKLSKPEMRLDSDVVYWAIEMLAACPTLEDFYETSITLQNGYTIKFKDCAANARETLAQEERRYVNHWKKMMNSIRKQKITDWREQIRSDDFFIRTLKPNPDGVLAQLREAGARRPDLEEEFFHMTYCYNGYVLARIIERMESQKVEGFSIDLNDTEDAQICAYLDVRKDHILVTDDKGTRRALNTAIRAYNNHYALNYQSGCRVIAPADYKQMFLQ